MTKRSRLVIAGSVLVVLVSAEIVWFAVIRDKIKPPERAKTTTELLVGTWKWTMVNGMEVSPDRAAEIEFNADGSLIIRVDDPKSGNVGVKRGTYTLEGQTLRLTSHEEVDAGQVWVWVITSISEDEFLMSEPPGSDSVRDRVFRRIRRA